MLDRSFEMWHCGSDRGLIDVAANIPVGLPAFIFEVRSSRFLAMTEKLLVYRCVGQ